MRIKKLSRRQVFLGIGAAVAVALAGTDVSTAQELRSSDIVYPTLHWELLEPSAAGWSADLLDKARAYAAASGSSAVMIVHHGRVIAEWGDTSRRTDIASVRKSLLSALFGIAIEEGRVKLSDTLADLGINDKPPSLTSERTAGHACRSPHVALGDLPPHRPGTCGRGGAASATWQPRTG